MTDGENKDDDCDEDFDCLGLEKIKEGLVLVSSQTKFQTSLSRLGLEL